MIAVPWSPMMSSKRGRIVLVRYLQICFIFGAKSGNVAHVRYVQLEIGPFAFPDATKSGERR